MPGLQFNFLTATGTQKKSGWGGPVSTVGKFNHLLLLEQKWIGLVTKPAIWRELKSGNRISTVSSEVSRWCRRRSRRWVLGENRYDLLYSTSVTRKLLHPAPSGYFLSFWAANKNLNFMQNGSSGLVVVWGCLWNIIFMINKAKRSKLKLGCRFGRWPKLGCQSGHQLHKVI